MADGFLGRWARRKEAVRQGVALPEEPVAAVPVPPAAARPEAPAQVEARQGGDASQAPPAPPPTLEDAQALTPASDFSRYVRADVPADVKNAAMKKLFADPHFNVMDRLDIYIDDYSQPDPLPAAMLRQLAGAKFLNLFDDDEQQTAADKSLAGREGANDPTAQSVAESGPDARTAPAVPPTEHHADPDLRLQQDDAPGREGPGARAR